LNIREHSSPNPWLIYLIWAVVPFVLFWKSLGDLLRYCLQNDNASHVLFIPFIVAWLFYSEREKISETRSFDVPLALLFTLPAVFIWGLFLRKEPLQADIQLSLTALAVTLLLIAGFIGVFGRESAKRSCFSLAFLGLAIPLPEFLLRKVIYTLQYFSAAIAESIFDWSGVPALREGFVFHLSGLSIEVARECSGIRSSVALVILALLVAHFSFSKFWKQAAFVFAGLAMTVVKNGVRIATLTILAEYVNPGFLFGRLHQEGGVVFFLLGLALLVPLYQLLRRNEPGHVRKGTTATD